MLDVSPGTTQRATARHAYPLQKDSAMAGCPYAALREQEPVTRVHGPYAVDAWLVTRYEDVCTVLTDPQFSRASMMEYGDPGNPLHMLARDDAGVLLNTDAPEHDRLRALVTRHVSARAVGALEPSLGALANDLVTRMREKAEAGERLEFNRDFAHPYALGAVATLVAHLLGVPDEDRPWFATTCQRFLTRIEPLPTPAERAEASREIGRYLHGLARRRHADPGDDLLTVALHDPSCSTQDVMSVLVNLMFGGYPSVVSALGSCVVWWLSHPPAWRDLATNSPETTTEMIDEVLRLHPSGERGLLRRATEDVVLGSVTVRAGDVVIPGIAAANRDPRRFEAPDAFDPARGLGRHLSFGRGTHVCLGMALARIELRTALTAVRRGFPELALARAAGDLVRTHLDMPISPIREIPLIAVRSSPSD